VSGTLPINRRACRVFVRPAEFGAMRYLPRMDDDGVNRLFEEARLISAAVLAEADRILDRLVSIYGTPSDGPEPAPSDEPAETNGPKTRRRRRT
jgi:hypothetical protein